MCNLMPVLVGRGHHCKRICMTCSDFVSPITFMHEPSR